MPIPGTTSKQTIPETAKEWGAGNLHSGKNGPLIPHTKAGQRQMLAIGYNYAKRNRERQQKNK